MTSDVRALTDLSTGRSVAQGVVDGVSVTVTTEPHPLRAELSGRAFVFVASGEAFMDDDEWEPVLGRLVKLAGGTLLVVRDVDLGVALEGSDPEDEMPDLLVPLTIRDLYYPEANVLVPLSKLRSRANLVAVDGGPRVSGDRKRCDHPFRNPPSSECLFCFWRWWNARAKDSKR